MTISFRCVSKHMAKTESSFNGLHVSRLLCGAVHVNGTIIIESVPVVESCSID